MKCKVGDLAWIIGGINIGWLVKVVELRSAGSLEGAGDE